MWGCDSEALRRNRFLGMWECDSEALRRNRFWGVGVRSLFEDVGSAIAKRSVGIAFWGCGECDRCFRGVGMRSLLGVWGCDHFWDVGDAIAVWGCGSAIAFGMWKCDYCLGCGDAIAVWGCGGCDRGFGSAIAYLGQKLKSNHLRQ